MYIDNFGVQKSFRLIHVSVFCCLLAIFGIGIAFPVDLSIIQSNFLHAN